MAKRLENYSKAVRYLRGNEILVVVGSNMDKAIQYKPIRIIQ